MIKKIKLFKKINIDFNKVIKMNLNHYILDQLFLISFKNRISNLVSLINNVFENINDFKSLKCLYLEHFDFDKNNTIKLDNLNIIHLRFCNNISR